MKTIIKNFPAINQEINRIFHLLTIQAPEDMVVIQEKARTGSGCCGMISILSREDMNRQNAGKNSRVTPKVRYVFYPSVYFPSCLGSVAIYSDDAAALCNQMRCQHTFFGIKILDVVVEYGKRPFVDVRLRA